MQGQTEAVAPDRRTRLTSVARRQQIVDVARRLFLTLGPSGTSMQKIAKEAGVNSALLYQHFDSVADLFEQVMLKPIEEEFLAALAEAEQAVSEMVGDKGHLELHVRMLRMLLPLAPVIGTLLFTDRFAARKFMVERVAAPLKQFVEKTLTDQGLLPVRDLESDVIVSAVLGVHMHLVLDAQYRQTELDVVKVAKQVHKTFRTGAFKR